MPDTDSTFDNFRKAAQKGDFLITAEVAPPKGGDPTHTIKMAATLKGRVHAVNITDGSRAVLGMSPLAASVILLQNGIEPICQFACRDRNRIGLQADLMGAHALGIRNILALTGDPIKAGDHPEAKAVFDLEAVRLLQLIRNMNQGFDFNQKPLSQLITDFEILEKFMDKIAGGYNKPILAGIFLLKSAKNAQFINKVVPGVNIPEHIINRLAKAKHPLEEGMKIAAEQVQIARDLCQGVHLMAVKREDLIAPILDLAGVGKVS